jgi:hypothetical protein
LAPAPSFEVFSQRRSANAGAEASDTAADALGGLDIISPHKAVFCPAGLFREAKD